MVSILFVILTLIFFIKGDSGAAVFAAMATVLFAAMDISDYIYGEPPDDGGTT